MAQPNRYKYNRPSSPAKKIAGSIGKSVLPAALSPGRKPLAGAINKSVLPAARSSMQPKSGQQYQNNYGKPGELTPYNPNATPEFTQEERVQAEMDRNQAEQVAAEEDLFGQSFSESTLREEIKRQSDLLAKQRESAQRSADIARMDINEQSRQGMQQIKSTEQAGLAATAPALNGPVSQSNVATQNRFLAESQRQSDYLLAQKEQKQAEVQDFLKQADEAERNGKKELALQYRNAAIRADNDVKQMDAEYLNSLANQSAEQRANFTMFTDLANQGMILDQEGLFNMAETLGLDPRIVTDYYNAVQSTRDNKAMDDQAKAIELERLKGEFEQYQRGVVGEEAQKIDNYLKLVQSGQYSEEQLQAFAIAMNIPDERNPVFLNELALQQAEVKIQTAAANGELINPLDQIEYANALAERNAIYGTGGQALVPSSSLEGFQVSWDGGKLNVTGGTPGKKYQCGEFVNRVWGLASGGSGGFGSDYKDKLAQIDIQASQLNEINFEQFIKPGMAFIMGASGDAAKYGHVGLVTQLLPGGYFKTAETNIPGDKINSSDATEKIRHISEVDGFSYPPNYTTEGSAGASEDTYFLALDSIKIPQDKAKYVNTRMEELLSSGKTQDAQNYIKNLVRTYADSEQRQILDKKKDSIAALGAIQEGFKALEDKGISTNIFTGLKEKGLRKLGLSYSDPEVNKLVTSVALAMIDYRQAVSGAAFTESEKRAYEEVFPSVGNTPELNDSLISSLLDKFTLDTETFYKNSIGEDYYDAIFGGQQDVSETPDEALSDYELIYGGGASESVDTGFNDFFNSDF